MRSPFDANPLIPWSHGQRPNFPSGVALMSGSSRFEGSTCRDFTCVSMRFPKRGSGVAEL